MAETLPELLDSRSHLLQEFSQLGDFQPGCISSVHRRCGKPTCHCAQPDDPGHGPLRRLTQKVAGKPYSGIISAFSEHRTRLIKQALSQVRHLDCALVGAWCSRNLRLKYNCSRQPSATSVREVSFDSVFLP
jgi:hypothetical protein